MEDYELLLFDRLEMIKTINKQHDLENNAYIGFSGGKDSTILHYLIDLALPNNKIPRVFINTGIEYVDIVKYVKELAKNDERFIIIPPKQPIKKVLETYGYPFKSKLHSHFISIYQNSGLTKFVQEYIKGVRKDGSKSMFACPNILKYQFTPNFNIKLNDKCCSKLKKEPFKKWEKENNKTITLTGMRKQEGGARSKLTCIITDKEKNVVKFHPLVVVSEEWETWFITKYNIKLCKLYYPPFNFYRTGCKGCPFALELQKQLNTMEELLPNEAKQCEIIWKPVYAEYRRIGYRLDSEKQMTLDDYL